MNSLSWFIYIAQVVDTLKVLLISFFVIFGVADVIGLKTALISKFDSLYGEHGKFYVWWEPLVKKSCLILAFTASLIVVVPDRTTMVLIAGSEIGERVMSSDNTKGVINPGLELLKTWISNETLRIKKEMKEESK